MRNDSAGFLFQLKCSQETHGQLAGDERFFDLVGTPIACVNLRDPTAVIRFKTFIASQG